MLDHLLAPIDYGALPAKNRVVMAPMTRSRADVDGTPTADVAMYYAQRAAAGLIVSEGIYPSEDGKGYCRTPGLVTDDHVAGWRTVTDAVHAEGGLIVAQIMHCGRVGASQNKQPGTEAVAPSAIPAAGLMYTDSDGMVPFHEPRALDAAEIPDVVAEYGRATTRALEAGFDGVELHGTSGYLPAQFLSTGSNQRTDMYGGSAANRSRFVLEVLDAMIAVAGADRVGLRICPGNTFNDLHDDDPVDTFETLLGSVESRRLAYLHVIRLHGADDPDNLALARAAVSAPIIGNDSYSADEADAAIGGSSVDAVSFGRPFIGNPDLVDRFRSGAAFEGFNPKALYSPGPEGYIDYPAAG